MIKKKNKTIVIFLGFLFLLNILISVAKKVLIKYPNILENEKPFLIVYLVAGVVFLTISIILSIKRKHKNIPEDDELSLKIKHIANSYASGLNIFLWYAFWQLADYIQTTKSIFLLGLMITAFNHLIIYYIVKWRFHD